MEKFIIGKLYICNSTKLVMFNIHCGDVFIAVDKETLAPVCLNPQSDNLFTCATQSEFECFSLYDVNKAANQMPRVEHPTWYQHPSGVECITIARHHDFDIGNALKYLWRAGLKTENGITDKEKEIEDLQKAVFYINDKIEQLKHQL